MNDSGSYELANSKFDLLKSDVAQTDLAPAAIRLDLSYQQIFRGLRSDVEADREMAKRDLRERIDPSKVGEMASWSRIAYAYLAIFSGDESLVDLLVPDANDAGEGDQIAAYKLTIQAFMRSRSSDLGESFALAKSAAQALGRMFARYELESAGALPTLTAPERHVLGALTFRLARGINSEERADIVSLLQQLLVRDKSSSGLQIRLIASAEDSDLTKEQLLGFERAKEARDALVFDAIEELIAYVKKGSKGAPRQDFNQLVRLEQLEDYIDRNARLLEQLGLFRARAYPSISAVQLNLKPEEAVVTHTLTLGGFVTYSCITSSGWEFKTVQYSTEESRQFASDEKLVNAAVRGTHSPSEVADATFPVDSAYRLYSLLFQPIEGCIDTKKAITLATDPDLFFIPWNALVTRQPPDNGLVRLKDVNWLVKSHAISLEPSIASFVALRSRKNITAAGSRYFLGVGDPQFSREETISRLVPKPLFVSRGSVDANSIGSLQLLPETRQEIISGRQCFLQTKPSCLLGPTRPSARCDNNACQISRS